MSSYVDGPFDGKRFTTRYDHLPIIRLEYTDIVDGKLVRMIADYELRCGMRVYTRSEPYPDMNHKVIKDGQE